MAKKILLVDDEPRLLSLVKSRLEASGYEVITASDGEEALAKVTSDQPDLVLLDVMMPKLDGLQVCEQIKNNENLAQIPVVILSAKNQQDTIMEAIKAGADGYMIKPFRPESLLAEVKKYLK